MNSEKEDNRTAANQRVYAAQVQDVLSDEDMEPFRPDGHDVRDTIEIHIAPEPLSPSRFLQMLVRYKIITPKTNVTEIVLKFKRTEQGWECTDREYY